MSVLGNYKIDNTIYLKVNADNLTVLLLKYAEILKETEPVYAEKKK